MVDKLICIKRISSAVIVGASLLGCRGVNSVDCSTPPFDSTNVSRFSTATYKNFVPGSSMLFNNLNVEREEGGNSIIKIRNSSPLITIGSNGDNSLIIDTTTTNMTVTLRINNELLAEASCK